MAIFHCPNCGRQDLSAMPEPHYFRCGECLGEFFILKWDPEPAGDNWAMPLLEEALGLKEVSPEVASFLKAQEGVPL